MSIIIGCLLVVGGFWVTTWKRLRVGKNKTIPLQNVDNPMTFSEIVKKVKQRSESYGVSICAMTRNFRVILPRKNRVMTQIETPLA